MDDYFDTRIFVRDTNNGWDNKVAQSSVMYSASYKGNDKLAKELYVDQHAIELVFSPLEPRKWKTTRVCVPFARQLQYPVVDLHNMSSLPKNPDAI